MYPEYYLFLGRTCTSTSTCTRSSLSALFTFPPPVQGWDRIKNKMNRKCSVQVPMVQLIEN
jgi:hypothetical protein